MKGFFSIYSLVILSFCSPLLSNDVLSDALDYLKCKEVKDNLNGEYNKCKFKELNCDSNSADFKDCSVEKLRYLDDIKTTLASTKLSDNEIKIILINLYISKNLYNKEILDKYFNLSKDQNVTRDDFSKIFDGINPYILILNFSTLIILLLYINHIASNQKKELKQLRDENNNLKNELGTFKRTNLQQVTRESMLQEINKVQLSLNSQMDEFKKSSLTKSSTEKIQVNNTTLFAQSPSEIGLFKNVINYRIDDLTYCYIIESHDNISGTLSITPNNKKILTFPDRYLSTGCEIENKNIATISNITVLSKGSAIFKDNNWVVTKKVLVRYE